MARTKELIRAEYNSLYISERGSAGLPADDPLLWSKYSYKALLRTVIVHCTFLLENFLELFKSDVDKKLKEDRTPRLDWYAKLALEFQYGFTLLAPPRATLFDNTGYTEQQIEASKVVKYSVAVKNENQFGRVSILIKTAGIDSSTGDLIQLSAPVVSALNNYYEREGAAGDKIICQSNPADSVKMNWKIYYDPLIINQAGNRNDGSETDVVKKSIRLYLTKINFSGVYVPEYHEDDVKKVNGIVIAKIVSCQAKYGNLPFAPVNDKYVPDSGWMRFADNADLQIEMIPQRPLR